MEILKKENMPSEAELSKNTKQNQKIIWALAVYFDKPITEERIKLFSEVLADVHCDLVAQVAQEIMRDEKIIFLPLASFILARAKKIWRSRAWT